MSRPPKENASDTRKIHMPIFPGVAAPYWASGGQTTGACAEVTLINWPKVNLPPAAAKSSWGNALTVK
jgi:hypothetical protein